MRLQSCCAGVAFLAAFVLNPAYFAGCITGNDDPEFKYDAQDMAKLVHAANDSFEFEAAGVRYRLDLSVAPAPKPGNASARLAPFARPAYACGDRRLYPTASACIDSSSMAVTGSFALFRLDGGTEQAVLTDAKVDGELWVGSLNLSTGEMTLQFEGGGLEIRERRRQVVLAVGFRIRRHEMDEEQLRACRAWRISAADGAGRGWPARCFDSSDPLLLRLRRA